MWELGKAEVDDDDEPDVSGRTQAGPDVITTEAATAASNTIMAHHSHLQLMFPGCHLGGFLVVSFIVTRMRAL